MALLDAGADANLRGPRGYTPLMVFEEQACQPCYGTTLDAEDAAMLDRLLQAGADPCLPPRYPFLLQSSMLAQRCIDFMLRGHAQRGPPAGAGADGAGP